MTVVPLVTGAVLARIVFKMKCLDLSELGAGSMADPPSLASAFSMSASDALAVAYATVFPFTSRARILVANILAIFLCL
ncbi:hypothetical protein [Verrucomicrobium spinosum]|uniref:aspartate-alanine antiporter-like transporter n=1 Tax=Verrucomicrobium spinosum TaxID=2736 RepID=UPI0012F63FBF